MNPRGLAHDGLQGWRRVVHEVAAAQGEKHVTVASVVIQLSGAPWTTSKLKYHMFGDFPNSCSMGNSFMIGIVTKKDIISIKVGGKKI